MHLAKTLGPFATLGLAEDTNALKSGVIDEAAFLKQTYDIHEEREKMFFDAIDKTRRGLVVCVFDITDRLQHMFFRYLDDSHPGNRGRDVVIHKEAVRELYRKMDDMIGRIRRRLDKDTVLMVMSDHGFKAFKRCVNLNTWLYKNGFMALNTDKPTGAEYYQDVDWSRTQAYALGFGGIYLNMAGREAKGIVEPGEQEAGVKRRILEKLKLLRDEQAGEQAIAEVYDKYDVYSGPYVREAPDLLVGFKVGYRASVKNVTGGLSDEVFEDNEKDWSGDHNFNPPDVPGMFFCNRSIDTDSPSILDIGPTVMDLFGVKVPRYCDGKSFMQAGSGSAQKTGAE
jgi:predicted AlkP superfamily phosphohydrolase/phosphomutase